MDQRRMVFQLTREGIVPSKYEYAGILLVPGTYENKQPEYVKSVLKDYDELKRRRKQRKETKAKETSEGVNDWLQLQVLIAQLNMEFPSQIPRFSTVREEFIKEGLLQETGLGRVTKKVTEDVLKGNARLHELLKSIVRRLSVDRHDVNFR
jgi:hypothetical protein